MRFLERRDLRQRRPRNDRQPHVSVRPDHHAAVNMV